MTSLNLANNQIATKKAGKALAQALAANTALKELDLSNIVDDGLGEGVPFPGADGPGFVAELALGVSANGALNKLTISGDSRGSEAVTIETSMTEADFSGKALGASGAIMLAAFLPKCQ